MLYFATRRCDHPAVYAINQSMLREHSRKFASISHWAFQEHEKEKALNWAGVKTVTPGRKDAIYPEYNQPDTENTENTEPVVPEPPMAPAEPMDTKATEMSEVETNAGEDDAETPRAAIEPMVSSGTNGLLTILETFAQADYSYAKITLITGESFFIILNDIQYWASNLIPTMFTPIYGGCDFKVRGSFSEKVDWNDMAEVRQNLANGNDGVELNHVLASSHRNLQKENPNSGLFKELKKASFTAFGSFVMIDRMYDSIERICELDLGHAMIGKAESLTYTCGKSFIDHVINENLVVSIVPKKIKEVVSL